MTTLRRWSNRGLLPAPIRFGGSRGQRYWKLSNLKQWLAKIENLTPEMREQAEKTLKITSEKRVQA
jgi:DNA-binding transcriptional MerR regulator